MPLTIEDLRSAGLICGSVALISLFLALILFFSTVRKLRRINVPEDATFMETLLLTPFSVVLLIDLLDLALDFLSAPIAWVLLDRLGLKALRGVSVVEAVIPGTQLLPTMTAAWLAARLFS